jgi:5'-methylthioadenosine phosphorylase
MPGLANMREYDIRTPFGKPSAPVVTGMLEGKWIAFLARHGIGHTIPPTEVNYRANIYALKTLGIERIVSISACGSLREEFAPGDIVIPDQVYDHTHLRPRSFFGPGLVAHVGVADPYCPDLSRQTAAAVRASGGELHQGGTLITIEGPRFSTKAESGLYRTWGMSIIGMTACPEIFLAREAEICYTTMSHVTDYDVWHLSESPVTADLVIATLNRNASLAQKAVRALARDLHSERRCTCSTALKDALITTPAAISPEMREKLKLLTEGYLN